LLTTVSGAVAETEPIAAVIVAEPTATPSTIPVAEPTVATEVALEIHVALTVISLVVPSVNVPIAVSSVWMPTATVAGFGVMAIDFTAAGATVNVVVPDTVPAVAVT
jgi:hypothetical protein